MGRVQNLKDAWNIYKTGEDWNTFNNKELGMARFYNYFTIVIYLSFFIIFNNLFFEILFILLVVHYIYRAYTLEKYLKDNFTKD